jgi:hypothetical protein
MVPPELLPRFEDYHRTIIGFHGTTRTAALQIVQGIEPFRPSEHPDDWLGHGIYFWEHGPRQAWWWAERRRRLAVDRGKWPAGEELAVLGSVIRLGHCLDLLDPANVRIVREWHDRLVATCAAAAITPPRNARQRKYLDCAVFQFGYNWLKSRGVRLDTVRAVYTSGRSEHRLWSHSWLMDDGHIQVCVQHPQAILGTWLAQPLTGEIRP